MNKVYPVYIRDRQSGDIFLQKEGLYWRYTGKIHPDTPGIYRIYALTGQDKINLGVCQPTKNGWVTSGKLPLNRLHGENFRFLVNPEETIQEQILTVKEDEPFEHLEELDQCKFSADNGKPAIILE